MGEGEGEGEGLGVGEEEGVGVGEGDGVDTGGVVTVSTLEYEELPAPFQARTR